MDPRENLLRIYHQLADWYERQRQPQMRDRFLVLAADAALLAGKPDEAERLRQRLLKFNPHHMLKPYTSFAQALKAPDVQTYVKDLRANYPANVAEDLLGTLQQGQPGAEVPVMGPPGDVGGSRTGALPQAEEEATLREGNDAASAPAPRGHRPARVEPVPPTIPLQKQPAARPLPTAPIPRPVARRPVVAPLPPDPRPAPPRPAEEPAVMPGSWLGALLFLLILACAAGIAGFTFLRPYLPMP